MPISENATTVSVAELDAAEELYLGQVGRVKRRGKPDWGHDFTVVAVKELDESGDIVLSLESDAKLPNGLPAVVVPNCPLRWFVLSEPASTSKSSPAVV